MHMLRSALAPLCSTLAVVSFILATTLSTTACITTSPAVAPTGEPLEVRLTYQDHGAFVDKDLNYHREGTWETFHGYFQGQTEVDELDFYAIAGDQKSVDGIIAWREAYNTNLLLSGAISGAGVAMLAGGLTWYGIGLQQDPDQGLSGSPQALGAGALTMGGLAVAGIGIYCWSAQFFGPKERLKEDDMHSHLYSFDRALKAEQAYNAKLAGGGASPEGAAPSESTPSAEPPADPASAPASP